MPNTATRRLINREASAVARKAGVTPTIAFLAIVRKHYAEDVADGRAEASVALTAHCLADCFQAYPTCTTGAWCLGCAAAIADGVVKGY